MDRRNEKDEFGGLARAEMDNASLPRPRREGGSSGGGQRKGGGGGKGSRLPLILALVLLALFWKAGKLDGLLGKLGGVQAQPFSVNGFLQSGGAALTSGAGVSNSASGAAQDWPAAPGFGYPAPANGAPYFAPAESGLYFAPAIGGDYGGGAGGWVMPPAGGGLATPMPPGVWIESPCASRGYGALIPPECYR